MTVASIPMLSPVTRSMPCVSAETPRMMFPPPMTIATSTPRRATSAISSARRSTTDGSIPKDWLPRRASPESFSRIRRYRGATGSPAHRGDSGRELPATRTLLDAFAHLEAHEADHGSVLARALGDDLGDLLAVVLGERLVEEHDLSVPLPDHP